MGQQLNRQDLRGKGHTRMIIDRVAATATVMVVTVEPCAEAGLCSRVAAVVVFDSCAVGAPKF
jgi:hypothetical protein